MDASLGVYALLGVLGAGDINMSTQAQRQRMAEVIYTQEARVKNGKLQVYKPPANDGGGSFEVAGINIRYHPAEAKALRALILGGEHEEAEARVKRYMLAYTDVVLTWGEMDAGLEMFLRDTAFNRGPGGAAMILQLALGGLTVDGIVGPKTRRAFAVADKKKLLGNLKAARANYEARKGIRANFIKGLRARWERVMVAALELRDEDDG